MRETPRVMTDTILVRLQPKYPYGTTRAPLGRPERHEPLFPPKYLSARCFVFVPPSQQTPGRPPFLHQFCPGRGGGEGTAVRIRTSEPGRFHDGSQNSRSCTGLAPSAIHVCTSEHPRRFEPSHRLGSVLFVVQHGLSIHSACAPLQQLQQVVAAQLPPNKNRKPSPPPYSAFRGPFKGPRSQGSSTWVTW